MGRKAMGIHMEKKRKFAVSLVGFKKKDVNDYILSMSSSLSQRLSDTQAALEKSEDANQLLTVENARLGSNSIMLSGEVTQLNTRVDEILASNQMLLEKNKKLTAEIEQMRSRSESLEADRGRIADTMLVAKVEAEKIIAEAHVEADTEVSKRQFELEDLRRQIEHERSVLAEMCAAVRDVASGYADRLDSVLTNDGSGDNPPLQIDFNRQKRINNR